MIVLPPFEDAPGWRIEPLPRSIPRKCAAASIGTTVALALSLTACGTVKPPEPIIKTVTVEVPITKPCAAVAPPRPTYPDPDTAPDIFVKVQRLAAGLILERADALSARLLLSSCTTAPEKAK